MENISCCEVCGNKNLIPVLNLGNHPMCDDLIPINNKKTCKEFPIEILFCENCNTAHQKYQVPKIELFPSNYHYRSRFTKDVLNGMEDLVESCEINFGNLNNKLVLDIGCNDGSLLDFFKQKNAKTIGVEPTDAYKDAKDKGHDVIGEYFSPSLAEIIKVKYGYPDFITFTNVFAHIENLKELVKALKILIGQNTSLVIENHYLGAVIDKFQFDTFYHEHPRTYSFNSFFEIAKSLGSNIQSVEFPSRYGGNIRVFISNINLNKNQDFDAILKKERSFLQGLKKINNDISKWKVETKKELMNRYNNYGKLLCKAFPGRAAIIVKLLEMDEKIVSAVYEKPGSLKIGHYVPGTRIPIKSDDEFPKGSKSPKTLINLAWHIKDEIKKYMKSSGYNAEIFDIINELK